MKIACVGYGKMGHMIAGAAKKRGHTIVLTCDAAAEDADLKTSDAAAIAEAVAQSGAEGVIEFTHPDSALANIKALLSTNIPLVVGTTGWRASLDEIVNLTNERGAALLYSSNFSLGVNILYKIIDYAAALMNDFDEYDAAVFEAHHNQKADAPSGTAREIANILLAKLDRKSVVAADAVSGAPKAGELRVASMRVGSVPGTHTVVFDSVADTIEITHRARSREGFALGAVRAIEWLKSPAKDGSPRVGAFTMDDVFASLLT